MGTSTRIILGAAALVLAGCDTGATGDVATIERSRLSSRAYSPVDPGMSLGERLLGGQASPEAPAAGAGQQDVPYEDLIDLDYTLPAGWKALSPTRMRKVNLEFEADGQAILYATIFRDQGGVLMNVNRWRKQMGLPPIDAAAVQGLERRPMANGEAFCVDLTGTFTGMGDTRVEGAGMLGAILHEETLKLSLFAKMVGPAEVIEAERARFYEFLAGIKPKMIAPPSPLDWEGPPGWEAELSDTEYRDVTFRKDGIEMYVSRARGTVTSNVNRWASQLQMAALDDAQLASLPRIPSMGAEAVIFEGQGTFQGMMDREPKPNQRMVAAVIPMPGSTSGDIVTVKMTGPEDRVAAARADFETLVTSLGLKDR